MGLPLEEVGFGLNRDVIAGLLRQRYAFDGVVCTDWGLLTSSEVAGRVMEARAWGVEHLSAAGRAKKALEAGVDQCGGEACPEVIVELVRAGQVSEARLGRSVRRLLRDKFRLGLFDQPYVDPGAAERIVGQAAFRQAGEVAQRRSIVLLKNGATPSGSALPVRGRPRLCIESVAPEVAGDCGDVVDRIEGADLAILRLNAPYEAREGFLEAVFHAGDLRFPPEEPARLLTILAKVPSGVVIYLERPAVIPEIATVSTALLGDFGASDAAVLDVVFGRFPPSAKLPFGMPSSMEAVRRQKEDVPCDSGGPLFPYGYSLSYPGQPTGWNLRLRDLRLGVVLSTQVESDSGSSSRHATTLRWRKSGSRDVWSRKCKCSLATGYTP